MTPQQLRADLLRLDDQRWRLISQDGSCCTITNPPKAWVDNLRRRAQGSGDDLDASFEQTLADRRLVQSGTSGHKVVIIGGGLLAAEVALGLAQMGVVVRVSAPQAAPVALDPLGVHASAAAAVREWVMGRMPSAKIEATQHWTALGDGCADLIVVASHTVQPDRAVTDHLARHWLPHLVVRAHHDTAVVGPLVDHQGGPCLACVDLAMADHDALWPATVGALTMAAAEPDASAAHWAGAQATLEAAWFMRGAGTTLRASTIETDATNSGVARRRWHPHKDCACQLGMADVIQLRRAA